MQQWAKWVRQIYTNQTCLLSRQAESVLEITFNHNLKPGVQQSQSPTYFVFADRTFSPSSLCCHPCARCSSLFLDIFGCKPVEKKKTEIPCSPYTGSDLSSALCGSKNSKLCGFRDVPHCRSQRKAQIWHLLCHPWQCSTPEGCPRCEGNRL